MAVKATNTFSQAKQSISHLIFEKPGTPKKRQNLAKSRFLRVFEFSWTLCCFCGLTWEKVFVAPTAIHML
jgi:hypothetical protein